MENNDNIVIIRKWYSVKTGLYVRDWTAEEYKKLSSDEHILEECDDGDLIECYCKETRMRESTAWKKTNSYEKFYAGDLSSMTADRTYRYNINYGWYNTSY